MFKLIVFISGNGSNLQAIIDACKSGCLINTCITLVVSNNKDAYGLIRAKENDIPTLVLEQNPMELRNEYNDRLLIHIINYQFDLIVLAGWMKILSENFITYIGSRKIINLHPARPGEFPGKTAIEDAYSAFVEKKITKTGVMVHEVVPQIDAGKVLFTLDINIEPSDTIDTLRSRIQYYEKVVLLKGIEYKKNEDTISKSKLLYTGKVRNIYSVDDPNQLLMVATDRQSAFDRDICSIVNKGKVINNASAEWFKLTNHIIDNHYISHVDNHMLVKKCTVFPIEVIVRGYITGTTKTSLWTHYNQGERIYCGITFPDGLKKNERLPFPVITPTTKGITDEPITANFIIENNIMTKNEWEYISNKALQLFSFGQQYSLEHGLILVDTKYEFGRDSSGNIILVDELHTCDSSRFWLAQTYSEKFTNGLEPDKYDKDLVRDYVKSICDPYTIKKIPDLPYDILKQVSLEYMRFYFKLFKHLDVYIPKTLHAIIIAGSINDKEHVNNIIAALDHYNLHSNVHYLSAHRETSKLLELLLEYKNQKCIYITVAGRSNALSGVVACNVNCPVIACPPFKDKTDMLVNIHSTLQCPNNVPVSTILEPTNVALFIKRCFDLH